MSFKTVRQIFLALLFYAGVSKLAQTLLMTVVASLVLMTDTHGRQLPNTVNEIASQYYFFVYALSALLVALTFWFGDKALYRHRAFWNEGGKRAWQLSKDRKRELARGATTAAPLVILFLCLLVATGQISYLGLFITSAMSTAIFPLFVLNVASLIVLTVCEEYIFRHGMLKKLLEELPVPVSISLSGLLYIVGKSVQFQLGWIELVNLFVLNCILGLFFVRTMRVHRGLAFLCVFMGLFHLIFGLPLWSQPGPSIFLFKHNAQAGIALLTGADAGPLGSLGLTSLLLLVWVGALWGWRKDAP